MAARVKNEQGLKPEPGIKPELDGVGASPAGTAMSEDDVYEDAGDLEFYEANDTGADSIFLTHIPKYLYDAWESMDDDAEIRIGTLRRWYNKGPNGERTHSNLAVLLDHQLAPHQQIPKEYTLEVKDMSLANTFLFTEQNLPGYKAKNQGPTDIPAYLRPKPERPAQNAQPEPETKRGRRARYQPRYKKAIPKRTVLAGRFRHELNCRPAWTAEAKHWLNIRNNDAMKPKATTTLTSSARPTGVIQAGAHVSHDKFSNFVRVGPEAKKGAKKQKEEKAARIPKSELRDQIFRCFEQFNFWSMKAFKQSLNQPEAWLRDNLEEVAVLHKTGRFANHWELNNDHKGALNILEGGGVAPDTAPEADDSDSDAEMEDVLPA